MITEELINEIRQKNDIVDVISSYIPLNLKGKNFFGICPFHQDTNPSLSVSRELQIYKCFSCGASGNVYNFVMDYEKVSFPEAVEKLGKRVGISVITNNKTKYNKKYEEMFKVNELARKYYQNNLNTKEGIKAKEYLLKRNINEDVINQFKIGLSLNENDQLTKLLQNQKYDLELLNEIGLSNKSYDTFINRIIFPLDDQFGKTVGFSGRIYHDEKINKYLNSKETPIFKKGEMLYNYSLAKESSRTKNDIIVVEGFMDVIRLYTIGITNVVALMGTSLTNEQTNQLVKLSRNIVLFLDGDDAGINATQTIGEKLINEKYNVKVISLKDNLDPDTYISENGQEAFNSLYEHAENYSDYKIRILKQNINIKSDEDVTNYVNLVLKQIANHEDPIYQELIINNLHKEFALSTAVLTKTLDSYKTKTPQKVIIKEIPKSGKKLNKYEAAVYAFIYLMLQEPKVITVYNDESIHFPTPEFRYLASEIAYYYQKYGVITVADFYTYLTDKPQLQEVLSEILGIDYNIEYSKTLIDDYIKVISSYNKNQEIKRLQNQIEKEVDPIVQASLADEIRKLKMRGE